MNNHTSANGAQHGQFTDISELLASAKDAEVQTSIQQQRAKQAETPQTPDKEAAEKNDERDKIRNPFPIKALPGPMRALVQAIVNNGHSEDKAGILALPMLGAVAATLGQGVVAQGREYIQHPNLYVYCNIDSGSIKSVAIDYAVAPIYAQQAQLLEDFNTNLKPDLLAKKISAENRAKDEGDEDELKKIHREISEAEKGLRPALLCIEDITIEALVEQGIEHEKFSIFTDESRVVNNLVAGKYSNGFSNEGPLCKAWSGKSLSNKRKNGDYMFCESVVGSIVMMGQNDITRKMLLDENMIESGFPARFLFDYRESPMLKRDKSRKPISKTITGNYETLILNCTLNYWNTYASNATTLVFSEAANDALDDFHDSFVEAGNGSLSTLRRNLQRAAELAGRVAIILHIADLNGNGIKNDADLVISAATTQRAIAIVRWSIENFIRYTTPILDDVFSELENELLLKVQEHWGLEKFSVRDLQRRLRGKQWQGADHVKFVINSLVKRGFLAADATEFKRIFPEKD